MQCRLSGGQSGLEERQHGARTLVRTTGMLLSTRPRVTNMLNCKEEQGVSYIQQDCIVESGSWRNCVIA